ncbi:MULTISPECIES: lipopolysaccharide kinase InaA family protein [Cycloclasticus]|jgi:hypothetical protein|uniref:lipopolysaccharide kinase InaA family protein n=1 Tax=Cycloclasticus TaxID=34067 RepID=UPI0024098C24|nr:MULTISPECIES: lipopolysaccharide kinase InaA family protein [Cycloclasticus]MBV1899057.1 lipopolysaccharide kinase InaA family protein [Cycloclasticus sp.]MDF1829966.1 lipopolysaccharide kinase InaA family protein [Cycloclasticus pugetii]
MVKPYINTAWQAILAFNKLETFEQLWALDAPWFEEKNQRRGGWSGVSRIDLLLPEGGSVGVFLKRQENHRKRSLAYPLSGRATFAVEFENIQRFEQLGINTLEPIFFSDNRQQGKLQAILMTRELTGFKPLSSDDFHLGGRYVDTTEKKLSLFKLLAGLMHQMHDKNIKHDCFYLKHVFARPVEKADMELKIIDLEKAKKVLFRKNATFRDVYSLLRHAQEWTDEDKLTFFKIYQGEEVLSATSRKLWRKINRKLESHKL